MAALSKSVSRETRELIRELEVNNSAIVHCAPTKRDRSRARTRLHRAAKLAGGIVETHYDEDLGAVVGLIVLWNDEN